MDLKQYKETFFKAIENAEFTDGNGKLNDNEWFSKVIDTLKNIKEKNNTMFFIGNGASSSMASHYATDFTKNGGINSNSLSDASLITCFSNDFSYVTAYMEMLKRYMKDGDSLFSISSSGNSENIVNASKFVKDNLKNSKVITFSGFSGDNKLRSIGDYNLYVDYNDYGIVESSHSYFLHLLIDMFLEGKAL